ncbi:MAG TPA: hypothetical protein VL335_01415 [Candidatus Paceibacterota bacterium]|jgi:hypothetical protein|nr:hypothetical protein [Candidatus Paceibacterota bacterium]
MRTVETILKLAFLGLAIYFLSTQAVLSPLFSLFLLVSIVLGMFLMLNHEASYHFKQSKKDLGIRKIEGGVLILFAAIVSSLGL